MKGKNKIGPYLVVGPTARVHYSCKSPKAAEEAAQEELDHYPDGECVIFKAVSRASRQIAPITIQTIESPSYNPWTRKVSST